MSPEQDAIHFLNGKDERIKTFLRELCAIDSADGQIAEVVEHTAAEMELLGFSNIHTDRMGCLIGSVGNGPLSILYDAHLDTVSPGNPGSWGFDPFKGKVEGDVLHALGACDTKGCTPGMIYGLAAAAQTGLAEDCTLYYYGSLEEQCDGLAPRVLVEEEGIRPDLVVIGEPTDLAVYRAQRGRVEIGVEFKGKSAHASMPEAGDNPVYRLPAVLQAVEQLNEELGSIGEGLRRGSVAVTDVRCQTASINAVPSLCTMYLDRRLGIGEEAEAAVAGIERCVPDSMREKVNVRVLVYDEPSYTGYVRAVEKVFPAWELSMDHEWVQAGMRAVEAAFGRPASSGGWPASTNGAYWQGTAGIPSIGFGPGDLQFAHSVEEHVRMSDVAAAARVYALLPQMIRE